MARWRCLECPSPIWVTGTYQDYLKHYYRHHYERTSHGP